MHRVCIIQARTGSSRLPGKVLRDLAGFPMLAQQIRRLKRCPSFDDIVIATTTNPVDTPILRVADREGVAWFRGPEEDVLGRFVGATREFRADVVIRTTADCPLIDPLVSARVVNALVAGADQFDYASNVVRRTYPRGLDTEAFFADTLFRIDRLAQSGPCREHVTLLPRSEMADQFFTCDVEDAEDNSDLRWTVDTLSDLETIRTIYKEMDLGNRPSSYRELLAFVRTHPRLTRLNERETTWSPT